jgi:hypothetical protein
MDALYLNPAMSINWRASLVPAAAVIPAPRAYTNIVAVKKLVVESRVHFGSSVPSTPKFFSPVHPQPGCGVLRSLACGGRTQKKEGGRERRNLFGFPHKAFRKCWVLSLRDLPLFWFYLVRSTKCGSDWCPPAEFQFSLIGDGNVGSYKTSARSLCWGDSLQRVNTHAQAKAEKASRKARIRGFCGGVCASFTCLLPRKPKFNVPLPRGCPQPLP